jgi:hypothetical protein
MTTARERRRKNRERRAASRRLPPLRGHGGGRLPTGGRARPVRMVGVGQFAQGISRRRSDRRPSHGLRRVGGVITGAVIALVFVLWIAARVGGHL